ncbi:lysophospholipid acyltransferase family protein [Ferruginibacter sp. SUN002]|uniref:lysophospholipid acyltransferase family protein n=1 Tax=Ferruginibacter sp. SUN002 TaxID=2937789 RepID=UPI003D35EE3D
MKYFLTILKAIFSIYGFVVFLLFMLIVFPIAVFLSFFGRIRGGNMIYKLCHWWTDCVTLLWGIFHKNLYKSPHDRNKQYVFIFNHTSYIDIPFLLKAIRNQHIRVLGKAEMAKIPIFGFMYRKAVVLVERDNAAARAKSVLQLKAIIKKGISIVIFPEGTFNMTNRPLKDFYDGAFRIAIETQTPIKPVVLLDAYDRLNYKSIFSLTPGRSRAVYLEEIPVDGLTLNDVTILKAKAYKLMEEKLIEYKANWITPSAP